MFYLKVPKRTLFFMGPQRCGSTTAMMQMLKLCANMGQRILLVGHHMYVKDFCTYAELTDPQFNIDELYLMSEARSKNLKLSDYDTVAFIGNTVFIEPGLVQTFEQVSADAVKLFERLCEPTAMLPRVYFETHYKGTERSFALG